VTYERRGPKNEEKEEKQEEEKELQAYI